MPYEESSREGQSESLRSVRRPLSLSWGATGLPAWWWQHPGRKAADARYESGAEHTEPADGLITGGVREEGKKDALTVLHFSKASILNDLIKTDQQQH